MPNGYHHLTYAERCQIHGLKASGYSQRAIAREMNRSPATISRELRRNSGDRGYRHQQAERKAQARRRHASSRPWKLTAGLWTLIEGCFCVWRGVRSRLPVVCASTVLFR